MSGGGVKQLFNWKNETRSSNNEIIFSECEFLTSLDSIKKGEKAQQISLNLYDLSLTCVLNSGKNVHFNLSLKKQSDEERSTASDKIYLQMGEYH